MFSIVPGPCFKHQGRETPDSLRSDFCHLPSFFPWSLFQQWVQTPQIQSWACHRCLFVLCLQVLEGPVGYDGDLSSWKPAVYRVKARSPITIQQVDCNKNPCSSGTDYVLMAPGKWIPLTRAGGGGWLPFALSRTPSPPAALALLLDP